MADLSQTAVVGKSWIRTNQIIIDNPNGKIPTITYKVERCYQFGDEVITKPMPDIVSVFDPDKIINVRDPRTSELVGTKLSMGEVYALIYSAFWDDAVEKGKY